ncbi:MAG: patatin-like phospholipase family protein [Bacteriovoracaceae bacterium]|nr:patatin-like phospholipase family protein [Bacteriovoracaceae bacterium]
MPKLNLNEMKNKKIALVLSGGVVKAASWHLGVAIALEELGFSFKNNTTDILQEKKSLEISTYVGSSAGAMICLYLALGLTPQEITDSAFGGKNSRLKRLTYKDMLYLKKSVMRPPKNSLYNPMEGFPTLIRKLLMPLNNFTGIFSTEGIKNYLVKHVIDNKLTRFEDLRSDLFVVATQLDHSRKVIFSKYNYPNPSHDPTSVYYTGTALADAVTASMSVPPIYSPYPIKNVLTGEIDYYIDGEIRETLSTHVAEDNNCDVAISSWTHTPYHYQDEVGSLIHYGLPTIAVQSILLMIQKKIISARAHRSTAMDIVQTVSDYMKHENFSNEHRRKILSILESKLHFKTNMQLIDIYPEHSDFKFFFHSTFSLNPKTAAYAVKAGYKRTMEVMNKLGDK